MLIVSKDIVSPTAPGLLRLLVVILTARSAVFICGETEEWVEEAVVEVVVGEDGAEDEGSRGVNNRMWNENENLYGRWLFIMATGIMPQF